MIRKRSWNARLVLTIRPVLGIELIDIAWGKLVAEWRRNDLHLHALALLRKHVTVL